MILSAEIMAISLATVASASLWTQAAALALSGLAVTAAVYGAVALIVKADDAGVALAQNAQPATALRRLLGSAASRAVDAGQPTAADRRLAPLTMALGRGLVRHMPAFLRGLSLLGTLAMLWVGGGIIVHGLATFDLAGIEHAIHAMGAPVRTAIPLVGGLIGWLVEAAAAGLIGLGIGWVTEKLWHAVRPAGA
jgi:hypothetical protein